MELKIRRSQRTSGLLGKTVIFGLNVRAEYTKEEAANIARYKLGDQFIIGDPETIGTLKNFFSTYVTISSLASGHQIDCKNLAELVEVERTLVKACKNLKNYLDIAATFDGREEVLDFAQA